MNDELAGWRGVPIVECGEPLEEIRLSSRVGARPMYAERGYRDASTVVVLRSGVRQRLEQAALALPRDLMLLVLDGWRSLALQRHLYDEYRSELAAGSSLSGAALDDLIQRYVSVPSADESCPSPHLTGGAVDVTLADVNGAPLDMGGEFDELTDRSTTTFYDGQAGGAETFATRRRMLRESLEGAGFTNLPSEWWHFDYGNQFWGCLTGRDAIYGRAGDQFA